MLPVRLTAAPLQKNRQRIGLFREKIEKEIMTPGSFG
jgi:hypothetical protein